MYEAYEYVMQNGIVKHDDYKGYNPNATGSTCDKEIV